MNKKRFVIFIMVISLIVFFLLSCPAQSATDDTDPTLPVQQKVETPTFSEDQGYYLSLSSVSISCSTTGTTKYYTTNGTEPTTLSFEYSTPIPVTTSVTIKVKAFKDGWTASDTATAYYNIATKREIIAVTGGSYTQTDGTNSFTHNISNFSLGKYEVTYELWYTVYTWGISNGYTFENPGVEGHNGTSGAEPTTSKYEPVTTVSWRDAIVWCNAYSEMTGLTPCYTYSSSVIKDSRVSNGTACDNAVCTWTNNGYRLPSEGEWQFTASNKGATPYNYASGSTDIYTNSTETQKVAWYSVNSGGSTKDVGTTTNPSALTFYDLSGNVREFCWDWHDTYPTTEQTDYRGAAAGSGFREWRGGSWKAQLTVGEDLQVGYRNGYLPTGAGDRVGFRVAKSG